MLSVALTGCFSSEGRRFDFSLDPDATTGGNPTLDSGASPARGEREAGEEAGVASAGLSGVGADSGGTPPTAVGPRAESGAPAVGIAEADSGGGGRASDAGTPDVAECDVDSPASCGTCDNDCFLPGVRAEAVHCVEGQCAYDAAACLAGLGDCNEQPGCETPLTTNGDCGACGITCQGDTPLCVSLGTETEEPTAQCASACAPGSVQCDEDCVELSSSELHCGVCGQACEQNEYCLDSSCQCTDGYELVGERCEPLCEGCRVDGECFPEGASPSGDSCLICDSGRSADAWTVDVGADCGDGPTECSAQDTCDASGVCMVNDIAYGEACVEKGNQCDGAGSCVSVCQPEQAYCNESCRDLPTDKRHCGACDAVCPFNGVCADGVCSLPPELSVLEVESGEYGYTLNDSSDLCGGLHVDMLGDLNGDGLTDFAAAGLYAGHIVYGTRSSPATDLANLGAGGITLRNPVEGEEQPFDGQARWTGDVNQDGIYDFVVHSGDGADGDSRVMFTPNTMPAEIDVEITDFDGFIIEPLDRVHLTYGAGDINGDGAGDLAVVAGSAVSVVFGKSSSEPVLMSALEYGLGVEVVAPAGALQANVSRTGDVNLDGKDDLLIGYPGADLALLLFGRTGSRQVTAEYLGAGGVLIGGAANLGQVVSAAGDVNADGYVDFIVSSGAESWVIFGQRDYNYSLSVDSLGAGGFKIIGEVSSMAMAGDVNNDGFADLLLGDRDFGPDSEGAAYVILGEAMPAPLSLSALNGRGVRFTGFRSQDQVGDSVAGGGDVNGDGVDDVVIGTSCPEDGISEVYVVLGLPPSL